MCTRSIKPSIESRDVENRDLRLLVLAPRRRLHARGRPEVWSRSERLIVRQLLDARLGPGVIAVGPDSVVPLAGLIV